MSAVTKISHISDTNKYNHNNELRNHIPIFSNKNIFIKNLNLLNKKIDYALTHIGINPNTYNLDENENSFSEYSILHDIVIEYENSTDKKVIQPLYHAIDHISLVFEKLCDFLLIIGKFFSYFFAPFFIFSAVYNWFCEKRRRSFNKAIRQPLYQAVQQLIEHKLISERIASLDVKNKLKYIFLMSSIDRNKTREILVEYPYINLIPIIKSEQESDSDTDAYANFSQYEIFIQNLFTVSHLPDDIKMHSKFEENLINNFGGESVKPLLKKIYSNLTLGEHIDQVGCGREVMKINESLYQIYGAECVLWNIEYDETLAFNFGAISYEEQSNEVESNYQNDVNEMQNKENENNNSQTENNYSRNEIQNKENENNNSQNENRNSQNENNDSQKEIRNKENENHFLKGIKDFSYEKINSDYDHYISYDGTICIAIKITSHTIKLEDAKRLGLVTPEIAIKLEHNLQTEIRLLYVIFRALSCIRDIFTSARNIMDGVPISIRNADKFTQFLIEKVENHNQEEEKEESNKAPLLPLFLGFSLGGMSATVMAVKYGFSSIAFNPLGIGKGVLNFIGENKVKIANDDNHAHCYQSYFMKRDWVSDPINNNFAKFFVAKPKIGQSYIIDQIPQYIINLNALRRHNLISILITDWTYDSIIHRISHFFDEYDSYNRLTQLEMFFLDDFKNNFMNKKTYNDEKLDNDGHDVSQEHSLENEKYLEIKINADDNIHDCLKQAFYFNLAKILGQGTMTKSENLKEVKFFLNQFLDDQSVSYKQKFLPCYMHFMELMND